MNGIKINDININNIRYPDLELHSLFLSENATLQVRRCDNFF